MWISHLFNGSNNIPSLILAGIALIISCLSYRTSMKSLKLSEQKEVGRKPRLEIGLNAAGSRMVPGGKQRVEFDITIVNRSDDANSISRAELELRGQRLGRPFILRIPPMRDSTPRVLSIPLKIDGHQTVAGVIGFEYDRNLTGRDFLIDDDGLIIEDSHRTSYGISHSIMRDREIEK